MSVRVKLCKSAYDVGSESGDICRPRSLCGVLDLAIWHTNTKSLSDTAPASMLNRNLYGLKIAYLLLATMDQVSIETY